jgi:hypothetical protein
MNVKIAELWTDATETVGVLSRGYVPAFIWKRIMDVK